MSPKQKTLAKEYPLTNNLFKRVYVFERERASQLAGTHMPGVGGGAEGLALSLISQPRDRRKSASYKRAVAKYRDLCNIYLFFLKVKGVRSKESRQ